MDNETPEARAAALPKSSPFAPAGLPGEVAQSPTRTNALTATVAAEDRDRTGVFARLVGGDTDIAGLVAYSIYKQNKLDWLRAFQSAKGRPPEEAELTAYILGEATPRRLATYRHLAEATLAGRGPEVDGGDSLPSHASFGLRGGFADRGALTPTLIATYALIAFLFLIGFWLAAHFTMSSR